MNKLAVVVVCFMAGLSASEPIRKKLRTELPFDYCLASSTDFLGQVSVDVSPYPIHVATGSSITITANVNLIKAIDVGSKISLKLTKLGIIDIPIPCLNIGDLPIPIGSCEYDGDELLSLVSLCPDHCPEGQENKLPLNPGQFGGSGLNLTIKDIPAILEPLLKGKIEVIGRVFNGAGEEEICAQTVVQLK